MLEAFDFPHDQKRDKDISLSQHIVHGESLNVRTTDRDRSPLQRDSDNNVLNETPQRRREGDEKQIRQLMKQLFRGFQRQIHTVGVSDMKNHKIHPRDKSNFWLDYGLMQQAGRWDLVDMNRPNALSGEPMPQQYVNKQIAVITRPSEICGKCQPNECPMKDGEPCVPWDKEYFDAYNAYRVSLGEEPISKENPVVISFTE
jgi:hypothetical protein